MNDKVTAALNSGMFVGTILIDLSRAFDTINHDILLKKCNRLGLRGKFFNILKDFMANRKVITKIEEEISEEGAIAYGVPQGSVLGPLLFLIYVNDIGNWSNNTIHYLFADDIILIAMEEHYETMIKKLQGDFNEIMSWCDTNELFINEEKTQFMCVASKNKKKLVTNKKIFFHKSGCSEKDCQCGNVIEVQDTKYLGLVVDTKWSNKKHIELVIRKLRQMMPKLYKLRSFLDTKNKIRIYSAWIESTLRYGIQAYGQAKKNLP